MIFNQPFLAIFLDLIVKSGIDKIRWKNNLIGKRINQVPIAIWNSSRLTFWFYNPCTYTLRIIYLDQIVTTKIHTFESMINSLSHTKLQLDACTTLHGKLISDILKIKILPSDT